MKNSKKIISSVLVGTFLFGVVAPTTLNVKTVKAAENQEADKVIIQNETLALLELQDELQKHNITVDDIVKGIQAELPQSTVLVQPELFSQSAISATTSTQNVTPFGAKTQAAKLAAKQMLKNIQRIGRVAWDRTVRQYVDKLPISKSAKSTLKKYIAYQSVTEVLNVVIDFSGTITNALSKQFQKMGCPAWLADMAARALVTLLL
ncbi:hypothetical protein [Bacillus sp. Hm123]|uniref:hypothetical protein n=1 Tax=Bacillus sp. Hm123 TaxID=3450745 RepID=UPI003F43FD8D